MEQENKKDSVKIPAGSGDSGPLAFSAAEILELALWIEKAGAEFYRLLSDEVKNDKVRNFFLRLMGMEMSHQRIIQDLMEDLPPPESSKLAFDETLTQREFFLHLRAMVEKKVFPQDLAFLAELQSYKDPMDALAMTLKIEERAIALYRSLSSFDLPYQKQGVIKKLIDEEESHIDEVKQILRSVEM